MHAFGELTLQARVSRDGGLGRRVGAQETDFKGVFFLVWVELPFPWAQIIDSLANCEPTEKPTKKAKLISDACTSFKRNTVSEAKTTSKKPAYLGSIKIRFLMRESHHFDGVKLSRQTNKGNACNS